MAEGDPKTPEELALLATATDGVSVANKKRTATEDELARATKNSSDADSIAVKIAKGVEEQIKRLGEQATAAAEKFNMLSGGALSNLTSSLGRLLPGIVAVGNSVARDFANPINTTDTVLVKHIPILAEADAAMSALARAQTTGRQTVTLFGEGILKANEAARLYPQNMRLAASTTGLTTQSIETMNKEMQQVPGALEPIGRGLDGITDAALANTMATAVMATTYRAFGITSEQAASRGREAWMQNNQTAEETVRQLGIMSAAQRATGVDRTTTVTQIEEISKSLGIYGQRTGAAAAMWTTFMQSLRESGVPINQVQEIVKQVSSSIAGMSIQHRAFIGMMSGMAQGRSALGGALQLELAMRTPEGLQRHLQSLTSTLAQVAGGRIVTIAEAAANPQLEMQFQVQRQTLQKMTGIAQPEQLNRILETMQKVESGGAGALEGSKELQNLYQEGLNTQENELSVLKRIEQHMQSMSGESFDRTIGGIQEAMRGFGEEPRTGGGLEDMRRLLGQQRTGAQTDIFGTTARQMGTFARRAASETMGRFRTIDAPRAKVEVIEAMQLLVRGAMGTETTPRVSDRRVPLRMPGTVPQSAMLRETTRQAERMAQESRSQTMADVFTESTTGRGTEATTGPAPTAMGRADVRVDRQEQMVGLLSEIRRELAPLRLVVPPAKLESEVAGVSKGTVTEKGDYTFTVKVVGEGDSVDVRRLRDEIYDKLKKMGEYTAGVRTE